MANEHEQSMYSRDQISEKVLRVMLENETVTLHQIREALPEIAPEVIAEEIVAQMTHGSIHHVQANRLVPVYAITVRGRETQNMLQGILAQRARELARELEPVNAWTEAGIA